MNNKKTAKKVKVRITRRPNQSVERAISMFNKKFQAARISTLVQAKRYFRKPLNKNKRRVKAIKREEYRTKREKAQYK